MATRRLRGARAPSLRLVFLAALLLGGLGLGAEAGGERAAAPWIVAIQRSLEEGRPAEAVETARTALGDIGTDSDLHLLYSRALLAATGEARPALAETEAALAADSFVAFRADEARLLEASLLLRLRRPADSLAVLARLDEKGAEGLLLRLRSLLLASDRGVAAPKLSSVSRPASGASTARAGMPAFVKAAATIRADSRSP